MAKPSTVKKPRPDFPLFPHQTGRWAKKVKGRMVYFGPVLPDGDHGAQAALERWLRDRDDLMAGRRPRPAAGLAVRDMVNQFLTSRQTRMDAGEITAKSFRDYYNAAASIVQVFGATRALADLQPDDFAQLRRHLARGRGPVALGNEIGRCRVVLNYAMRHGLAERPFVFGDSFSKPPRKVLRQAKLDAGPRMFEAHELRAIIGAAKQPMKAMVLLGINCAFGPADLAALPLDAIDLESEWIVFPRPKTAILRKCPLWAETVAALRQAIAKRPKAKDAAHTGLAFITKHGHAWVRTERSKKDAKKFTAMDAVAGAFDKAVEAAGVDRKGRGFYCLRRGFETVAGDTGDQVAIDGIMGHVADARDMGAVYRQRVSDERLLRVVQAVHDWVWPAGTPRDRSRPRRKAK